MLLQVAVRDIGQLTDFEIARTGAIRTRMAFLASDEAPFVTGQTVSVSGGLTMS
jgi:NAD(P)-dependent dehydrogenase (short-subunit alcohol dehydrogenase family)